MLAGGRPVMAKAAMVSSKGKQQLSFPAPSRLKCSTSSTSTCVQERWTLQSWLTLIAARPCKAFVARVARFVSTRLREGCSIGALRVHGSPQAVASLGTDPLGHLCGLGSRCVRLADADVPAQGVGVMARWLSVKDLMKLDGGESYLAQYVTNASETFTKLCGDWCFSIATDKAL